MFFGKQLTSAAVMGVLTFLTALPTHAADDLTFINKTHQVLTFFANNAKCSSDFGEGGIVMPHSSTLFSADAVTALCTDNPDTCAIEIHTSKDCSGEAVAGMKVDAHINLFEVSSLVPNYTISGNAVENTVALSEHSATQHSKS
jgi:hypothetical protein